MGSEGRWFESSPPGCREVAQLAARQNESLAVHMFGLQAARLASELLILRRAGSSDAWPEMLASQMVPPAAISRSPVGSAGQSRSKPSKQRRSCRIGAQPSIAGHGHLKPSSSAPAEMSRDPQQTAGRILSKPIQSRRPYPVEIQK